MKKCYLLFFFLLFSCAAFAQIGVQFAYSYANAPYWNQLLGENEALYKNGQSFSIDYAYDLKNIKAKVGLELGYSQFKTEIPRFRNAQTAFFSSQFYHAQANVRLYVLDLLQPMLNNGVDTKKLPELVARHTVAHRFFVQFSPGSSMVYHSYRTPEESQLPARRRALFLALGAGFDMYYGKRFCLTPTVIYRYYPSVNWDGLTDLRTPDSEIYLQDNSFVSQFAIGMRMSWL